MKYSIYDNITTLLSDDNSHYLVTSPPNILYMIALFYFTQDDIKYSIHDNITTLLSDDVCVCVCVSVCVCVKYSIYDNIITLLSDHNSSPRYLATKYSMYIIALFYFVQDDIKYYI